MLSYNFCAVSFAFTVFSTVLSTDITTYSDGACQKSFDNLRTVNGYPDGVCTSLEVSANGSPKTFQLARLDSGCAVTLYGPNEGPLICSSSVKIVADLNTCYNATWVYYSIDGCLKSGPSSIILPTATSTSGNSSHTSSTTTTATATAPAPANASSSATSTPSSKRTGAVVGGITGSVAAFSLIFAVVLFLICKRRIEKSLPPLPTYELPDDHALLEAGRGSIRYPEKARMDLALEIGRNSGFVFRAELPGDSACGDKKAMH